MEEWNYNPLLYCVRFQRKRCIIELPFVLLSGAQPEICNVSDDYFGGLGAEPPALENFVFF